MYQGCSKIQNNYVPSTLFISVPTKGDSLESLNVPNVTAHGVVEILGITWDNSVLPVRSWSTHTPWDPFNGTCYIILIMLYIHMYTYHTYLVCRVMFTGLEGMKEVVPIPATCVRSARGWDTVAVDCLYINGQTNNIISWSIVDLLRSVWWILLMILIIYSHNNYQWLKKVQWILLVYSYHVINYWEALELQYMTWLAKTSLHLLRNVHHNYIHSEAQNTCE